MIRSWWVLWHTCVIHGCTLYSQLLGCCTFNIITLTEDAILHRSECFTIGNGTKQEWVLSPYLLHVISDICGLLYRYWVVFFATFETIQQIFWLMLMILYLWRLRGVLFKNFCIYWRITVLFLVFLVVPGKQSMEFCPHDESKIVAERFPLFILCGQTLEIWVWILLSSSHHRWAVEWW